MNDGTIAKIKEVNQRLSDLCGLPYTDFYKADRFVALFELPINNSDLGTLNRALRIYAYNDFFNRITFLEKVVDYIDMRKDDKVIRSIQREFKGLGG